MNNKDPFDICTYVVNQLVAKGKLPKYVDFMSVSNGAVKGFYELELYDQHVDHYLDDLKAQYDQQGMDWKASKLDDQRNCKVMLEEELFTEESYNRDKAWRIPDDVPLEGKAMMRVARRIMFDYKTWRNNYWKHVN